MPYKTLMADDDQLKVRDIKIRYYHLGALGTVLLCIWRGGGTLAEWGGEGRGEVATLSKRKLITELCPGD